MGAAPAPMEQVNVFGRFFTKAWGGKKRGREHKPKCPFSIKFFDACNAMFGGIERLIGW